MKIVKYKFKNDNPKRRRRGRQQTELQWSWLAGTDACLASDGAAGGEVQKRRNTVVDKVTIEMICFYKLMPYLQ